MNHLSQQEHAFISNRDSEKRDLDTFSWRYESCWALLWSLGLVEEPLRPDQQCNVEIMYEILTEKGSELTERANFRSLAEILDYLDLIYRYDWACVEARLNGQDAPGDLDPGIVYERHYALNWLVNYMSQDWDEVTCDT